ncbi:hypothetical protein EOS_41185 [Caballeronia mineralivorans PML1(12)]|uniref:Uncharacterized protein n=1 Tax=Caballeronia mineralivorans PML1(12) TaxID=908627 RepID=A0A0J1CIM0_9BURK|nr:hypothetical protein EOS_41185 [Caballeronia mineralivorans PML1(12)]
MDLGKSLVVHSKTMEIMEPSMSTFDYPSILFEVRLADGALRLKKSLLVSLSEQDRNRTRSEASMCPVSP